MKLADLFENENQYLYHATFTKNVPKIKKEGLVQYKTSNWVRSGDPKGDRYNADAGIFAFTHPEDAFKWALKMSFDMDDKDISIVRLNMGEHWEEDPSEDPTFSMMSKGKARRSLRNRKADEIVDAFRLEDFSNPRKLGIPQHEWIENAVKILIKPHH